MLAADCSAPRNPLPKGPLHPLAIGAIQFPGGSFTCWNPSRVFTAHYYTCSPAYNGGVMLLSRKWRPWLFVLALSVLVPHLSAVIVEGRSYHGKEVQCVHGGAWFAETALGAYSRTQIYDQVFTGTVRSAVEITDTDKHLQIVPDEVFQGDVAGEVTATVNQACMPEGLPEIKAGDKWLFYTRMKKYLHPETNPPYITTDGLVVVFDSPSAPVSEAQNDICLLRHHSDESESCASAPTLRNQHIHSFMCERPIPIASPSSHLSAVRQAQTTDVQLDGIDLTHFITPPEFRAYDHEIVDSLKIRPWPPCS
jgi:hypothetical protein